MVVYPEWWGATGDGATDDTTAIQQAATFVCKSGKRLSFDSSKTYLIDGVVSFTQDAGLAHPVVVDGNDCLIKASDTFDATVLSGAASMFVCNGDGQSFEFRNLRFDGNEATLARHYNTTPGPTGRFYGLTGNISDIPRLLIDNVVVTNIGGAGIYFLQADDVHISRCNLDTWYHGIFVKNFDEVAISVCKCTSNRSSQTPSQLGGGVGILLTKGSKARVEGCTIDDIWDTGSKTEGVSDVIYANNIVTRCGKDGLKIQAHAEQTEVPQRAVLQGNIVKDLFPFRTDGSTCIQVGDVFAVTVSGNTVSSDPAVTGVDRVGIRTFNIASGTLGQAAQIVVTGNEVGQCSDFTTGSPDIDISGKSGGGHTFVVANNMSTTGIKVGDSAGTSTVTGNVVGSDLNAAQTFNNVGIQLYGRMVSCTGNTIKNPLGQAISYSNSVLPGGDGIAVVCISSNTMIGGLRCVDVGGVGVIDCSIANNVCIDVTAEKPIRLRVADIDFQSLAIVGNTFKGTGPRTLVEFLNRTTEILGHCIVDGNTINSSTASSQFSSNFADRSLRVIGEGAIASTPPTHATNYVRGDVLRNRAAAVGQPTGWMTTSSPTATPVVQTWVALANL